MWDPVWDEMFSKNNWGKYPPEELVRFVARNFYKTPREDRSKVDFLDVGCGPGSCMWYLAREGFSVTGIDGSAVALQQAEKFLASDNLSAELTRGDIVALPYEDESFDCVIDIECLNNVTLADARSALAEIRRVLKPKGLLFSRTFSTGTSGEGEGEHLEGEPNTYTKIKTGAFRRDKGVFRFTDETEINTLYDGFGSIEYDLMHRTDANQSIDIREWMITCRK